MSIERVAHESVNTSEQPAAAGADAAAAHAVLALVGLDPIAAMITFDVLAGGEQPC